jgi:hypothetical protein
MGNFPAGGSTFVNTWAFHTGGLAGPSAFGTFQGDPTSFNRLAVSYDPANHLAFTSINGQVLAAVPYTPPAPSNTSRRRILERQRRQLRGAVNHRSACPPAP